jgi:hypothetical protein
MSKFKQSKAAAVGSKGWRPKRRKFKLREINILTRPTPQTNRTPHAQRKHMNPKSVMNLPPTRRPSFAHEIRRKDAKKENVWFGSNHFISGTTWWIWMIPRPCESSLWVQSGATTSDWFTWQPIDQTSLGKSKQTVFFRNYWMDFNDSKTIREFTASAVGCKYTFVS